MAETTLPEVREALAHSALYEITHISVILRGLMDREDDTQAMLAVARGMLARVQQLSEATHDCILGERAGMPSDDELFEIIECRPIA